MTRPLRTFLSLALCLNMQRCKQKKMHPDHKEKREHAMLTHEAKHLPARRAADLNRLLSLSLPIHNNYHERNQGEMHPPPSCRSQRGRAWNSAIDQGVAPARCGVKKGRMTSYRIRALHATRASQILADAANSCGAGNFGPNSHYTRTHQTEGL
jgi:hypothetical protein